jgi:Tol biopolymer transport system component
VGSIMLRCAMLILAAAIASCSGGEPALSEEVAATSHASDPPDAPVQGRVLFARIMSSGASRHYVIDADGTGQRPFAPGRAFETRNLSPDGSRLAIVAVNDGGVIVGGTVGVDGKGFRLFESPDPTLNLACGVWAPHGRMACEGWDDTDQSRNGIYTVRASDGSDLQRVTHGRDVPCDYAPDGTRLAFVRVEGDDSVGTLTLMDADGTRIRPLFRDVTLSGTACDWSPDGRSILTGSDGTLVLVSPNGTSTSLTGEGIDGYASGAIWSPDGTRILFSMALEGEQFDVYSAAADGSDLTRITDSELLEEALAWLP